VANVSYLRPAGLTERSAQRAHRRLTAPQRSGRNGRYILGGGLVVLLVVAAAGVLVLVSAGASLTADSNALAVVGMPLGGGKIQSVTVVTGPHSRRVPIELRGNAIWPKGLIPAHEALSIDVVVKRPGWIAWLAGSTEHLKLSLMTPSASLRSHYLTLGTGAPLKLQFKDPIRVISYGQPGQLQRHVLGSPRTEVNLPRTADAGTISVAAAPRVWETSPPAVVSWFPAGASASAVASPGPGSQIQPNTPISLTFSKTVDAALGSARPPVSPTTQGTWHTVNSHTIVFRPEGYGYGLGANVSIGLPNGTRLVGGQQSGTANGGTWTVPQGSPLRMQQLLAELGYLPLRFHSASGPVAPTPEAQQVAATKPPAGHFTWRYGNVPASLHGMWSPGTDGTMTNGALMAFQNDHGLTADGKTTPTLWRALINAAVAGKRSTFGYSYVSVNMGSPETLTVWHNGHNVATTDVNTGIPSRPTATGTYPVYEHIRSGSMSGTNPDGSHYDDPGIQFISYFNGGDALHAFDRGSYGSPQSLGCVEMALGPAGQVWPYTPIGTLVHVA
jgi:peptidoglycan hydrolase-like protein with peptidoglycan-binding domain